MGKRILACILSMLTVIGCVSGIVGCTGNSGEDIDDTKTQLRVHSFNGGVGSAWLDDIKSSFEEKYKYTEFEPGSGKKGVQILISSDSTRYTSTTIKTSPIDVFFLENGSIIDLSSSGAALKVTDIVTTKYEDEELSIEDRMDDRQKSVLKYNGDYYVIPHYEFYGGLIYDIDVFNDKKLYMAETPGQWTNLAGKKSDGPDGIPSTEDDGLPATYEEFYALCERMVAQGVTPFMCVGDQTYPNYLLQALFANYCGADEALLNVDFDSGDDTTEIITGFSSDGTPIIEDVQITPPTGYLLSKQAGKYYALEFLEHVLSQNGSNGTNAWYDRIGFASTTTHTEAQETFIRGYFENEPYGLLIDGAYWYNEAEKSGALARLSSVYDGVEDRRFGWMSLPTVASGETGGKKQVLADLAYSFCVINGTLVDNENIANLAKLFVQFCYTETNLQNFTIQTGTPRALQYDLGDRVNELTDFSQSVWRTRMSADVIQPVSSNDIFINNQSAFSWNIGMNFWRSTAGGSQTSWPFNKFKPGSSHVSAREYFEGMEITQSSWSELYGQWYS